MPNLILTRRPGERVIINAGGEQIVVRVDRVYGQYVRLAFDAPQSVTIHREEVQARVDAEQGGAE